MKKEKWYRIPLLGGEDDVMISVPGQLMTEEQWGAFIEILQLFKLGMVQPRLNLDVPDQSVREER